MVNLRSEDDFISNDNKKQVAADGPGSVKYFETTSANLKPGMPYKIVAGTSTGIVEMAIADSGFKNSHGIVELNKNIIDDCTTGYATGKLIPCLPYAENQGLICRNLFGCDPGAAVEMKSIMAGTLTGFLPAASSFTSGNYVETYKYRADPGADYRFIGRIL